MYDQKKTKSLVESGLLTAVAVVLILITNYVPVLGAIGMFIWPIPLSLIIMRHGLKYSILSIIVIWIISAITVDPITATSLVLIFGTSGIILGYCARNKKSFSFTFFLMSLVMFISVIIIIKVMSLIAGYDIIRQGLEELMKSMDLAKKMYSSVGVPQESLDNALKMMPSVDAMLLLLPASMALFALTMSFINYLVAGKIFERFGYSLEKVRPLSEWYIPSNVAIGLILVILLGYLLSYFKVSNAQAYLTNGIAIFSLVFTVNGVAFLSHLLKKKGVTKGVRWIIYFFLVTTMFISFMSYAGMFDYALDFRKLDPSRPKRV